MFFFFFSLDHQITYDARKYINTTCPHKLNKRSRRGEREANDKRAGRYWTSPGLGNGNVSSSISVVSANTSVTPLLQPLICTSLPPSTTHYPHPSICLSDSPRPRPPSAFKPPFLSLPCFGRRHVHARPASAAVQRWDVPTCMRWRGGSWEESCMQGGGGGERGWRVCVFLFHPYSPVFVCWCSALTQQRNFKVEIVQMSFRIDRVLDVRRLWLDAKLRLEHIFLVRYFKCSVSCLFWFRLGFSRLWDVFNMTVGSLLEVHSNVQNYPGISKCNHSKSKMTV